MTQDEYIKELKRLYEMAVVEKDINLAAELLDRIRRQEGSVAYKEKDNGKEDS